MGYELTCLAGRGEAVAVRDDPGPRCIRDRTRDTAERQLVRDRYRTVCEQGRFAAAADLYAPDAVRHGGLQGRLSVISSRLRVTNPTANPGRPYAVTGARSVVRRARPGPSDTFLPGL
jgi:hypothetical protein